VDLCCESAPSRERAPLWLDAFEVIALMRSGIASGRSFLIRALETSVFCSSEFTDDGAIIELRRSDNKFIVLSPFLNIGFEEVYVSQCEVSLASACDRQQTGLRGGFQTPPRTTLSNCFLL
jgi:hypothetical protein